jgi:hypothetical protein
MAAQGEEPDEVTQAALEAVAEATEVADQEHRRRLALRRRVWRGRVPGRPARRGDRTGRPPARTEVIEVREGEPSTTRADGAELMPRVSTTRSRRLGVALGGASRRGAQAAGRGLTGGGRRLAAQVMAMAPRLPVRDLATLRAQFGALSPDDLADALIEGASRASAAVGVAVGAWAVLPFLPAAGVEIATETLAVVGIEIKLVAELHEVYGLRAPGGVIDRAGAYVAAWAHRRGVALAPGGLVIVAGSPVARQLQRRLARRAGRSALSLGPLLSGAVAGGLINRRETRKLGRILRDDLRARSPHADGWPEEDGG